MEQFLLNNDVAERLYFETASEQPIIDYHNHLSIRDLAMNRKYENIYELWLKSDPYKHRAMRICGVNEEYITGKADDYQKFEQWSAVLPKLVGNPLYHWTQMELSQVFGIDLPLNKDSAREIWKLTNDALNDKSFSAQNLLKKFKVEYSAPCTSIVDDLTLFEKAGNATVPSLRGDDITAPDKSFIKALEKQAELEIIDLDSFLEGVFTQIKKLDRIGCSFADHALDNGFNYCYDEGCAKKVFQDVLEGKNLNQQAEMWLRSVVLRRLGEYYSRLNWTVQLHIGAQRYTSSRLRNIAGPAGGYAAIGSPCDIQSIIKLLDDIENACGEIPKIILFTLNPADNAVMSVLSGSFSKNGTPAVVGQGPAWWWCDHMYGIREALENVSAFGVLSTFVGMTTDSRSILSFVRHDYFRRILCGWLADKMKSGEFPMDFELMNNIVKNLCCDNAKALIKKEGR